MLFKKGNKVQAFTILYKERSKVVSYPHRVQEARKGGMQASRQANGKNFSTPTEPCP